MIRESQSEPAVVLDPRLRASLLAAHRASAFTLVAEALGRWRDGGYVRYDDRENSCTVRVFSCMEDILEIAIADNPVQIIPVIEGMRPTAGQLSGKDNVSRAKRADLVLYLGGNHVVRMAVECKRFLGNANATEYVENGIVRFLAGHYDTDSGRSLMLGYVMSRSIAVRVTQVNTVIATHRLMGASHVVSGPSPIPPIPDAFTSTHDGYGVTITHMLVDMVRAVRDKTGRLKV